MKILLARYEDTCPNMNKNVFWSKCRSFLLCSWLQLFDKVLYWTTRRAFLGRLQRPALLRAEFYKRVQGSTDHQTPDGPLELQPEHL